MKILIPFILLVISLNTSARDLSFLNSPKSKMITIGEKKFGDFTDKIFKDGLGREAYFRGWNVSNESKGAPFLPYGNNDFDHYKDHLLNLKKRNGSNILRWLVSWDGIHPQVDVIDYNYLRKIVKSWKYAMSLGFYILIDYHQDLFSNHINDGSNGAPKWVVDGMHLPPGKCAIPLVGCLSWAMNYFTNKAVKHALRHFWDNRKIDTIKGRRFPQNEFIWMQRRALNYFKDHLTKDEFKMIIGLDPWNEPADGGLQYYKGLSAAEWSETKLWPFYRNIRKMMDNNGWYNKPLFAEPHMNWNANLPLLRPRGEGFLKDIPKRGYVFNAHVYDESREGFPHMGRLILNGTYLKELDRVRNEGRYLGQPTFVSEYGAWGNTRVFDSNRMIKAIYQGLEISMTSKKNRNRFTDFYSPLIGSTQWVWSLSGGWPSNGLTEGYRPEYDQRVMERAYPRRVQGDIMTFFYDDIGNTSYKPEKMKWACLRLKDKCYFDDEKFIWLVWRGRKSNAPTEIFIPRHFKLDKLLLITEQKIQYGIGDKLVPTGESNEFFVRPAIDGVIDSGHRLFVYDDKDSRENKNSFHYLALGEIDEAKIPGPDQLKKIQTLLRKKLVQKKSPLFLMGKVRIDKPKKAYPHKK
jgi:hypothetical protein